MHRHECLAAVVDDLHDALVVTTNGRTSSEWLILARPEMRDRQWRMKTMGLCSSVGLGLALRLPGVQVVAFDGDGSILMNASSLATVGRYRPGNLLHVVFDNGLYDTSGEIETHTGAARARGEEVDLVTMAKGAC